MLKHYKDILADELIQATEDAKLGKAKPKRVANQLIMVLGAEVVAHYTVSSIVNGQGLNVTLAKSVRELSKTLQKEFRLHEATEAEKDRFKYLTTL